VVERLLAHGVEVTFGIPAQMNLAMYDAFLDHPPLRQILTRHELGAAYMADGYARATGRPGVVNVVGGPGLTNALTGIAAARQASSPILVMTTTIAENLLGQDRPTTHELPDQGALIDSVAAWRGRVTDVTQIEVAIDEAFDRLATRRPRPLIVEFTPDVLAARAVPSGAPVSRQLSRPAPDDDSVRAAARALADAEAPLIWAGGGAVGAAAELRTLAERLGAPVFTTDGSRGVIPDGHPLSLGASWVPGDPVARILAAADVVLAVATTFSAFQTADWTVPLPGRIVQLDIDADELGKNLPIAIGLHGDAALTLGRLLEVLPVAPGAADRRGESERAVATARAAVRDAAVAEGGRRTLTSTGTIMDLLDAIRGALPADGILAVDSLAGYWVSRHFPVDCPRTIELDLTLGGLGFALPAAIGSKVGVPNRPVVALAGDGAFLFTGQELGTAVQENLTVPIVVYNDGGYGSIRWNQRRRYGRLVAADMVQPDFVALARAYGARGVRVSAAHEVGPALAEALALAGPTLIEVAMSIEPPHLG
jgi:acetolactate synthase-1/2/3 large subunit